MLLLAVHRVETETAKVPLSMIILMDYVKRRSLPADLKCRVVLPCGDVSVSVWDAPSQVALEDWLDTYIVPSEPGLTTTCHEVQEDFSYGLATALAQARAAEKVVAGSKTAMDTLSKGAITAGGNIMKQLEVFDNRTNLLTATGEAFTNLRSKTSQAIESERVTSAMSTLSVGWSNAGTWLSKVSLSLVPPKPTDQAQAYNTAATAAPQPPHHLPLSSHHPGALAAVEEGEEEVAEQQARGLPMSAPATVAAMSAGKKAEPAAAAASAAGPGAGAGGADALLAPPAQMPDSPAQRPAAAAEEHMPTFVLSDETLDMPTALDVQSAQLLPPSVPATTPRV